MFLERTISCHRQDTLIHSLINSRYFQRSPEADKAVATPKNVIIQWETPQVIVRQEVKYLGTIAANPAEYRLKYEGSMKEARDLPKFVLDIERPLGVTLAADVKTNGVFELEGQVEALRLVDLDREGLAEYRYA